MTTPLPPGRHEGPEEHRDHSRSGEQHGERSRVESVPNMIRGIKGGGLRFAIVAVVLVLGAVAVLIHGCQREPSSPSELRTLPSTGVSGTNPVPAWGTSRAE